MVTTAGREQTDGRTDELMKNAASPVNHIDPSICDMIRRR